MEIQIGKAPDFIMTRGREVVFHRSSISIYDGTHRIVNQSISNRSLDLLFREIMSICKAKNLESALQFASTETVDNPRRYQVLLQSNAIKLTIWLHLEEQLNLNEASKITGAFKDYFDISKSRKGASTADIS